LATGFFLPVFLVLRCREEKIETLSNSFGQIMHVGVSVFFPSFRPVFGSVGFKFRFEAFVHREFDFVTDSSEF